MRVLARVPAKWRQRLDHWPVWMGIAFFGLVAVSVWVMTVQQHTARVQAAQARNDAIRIAEARAAANSAYQRCIGSIAPTMRVSTHVAGVNEAFGVLLRNSRATLAATPRSDPQRAVRAANLERLEAAVRKVAAIKSFPAPTRAECAQRRREALRGIR